MSKNVKTLSKNFKSTALLEKSILELKKENRALKQTVSKLLSEIDRVQNIDRSTIVKLDLSPEQEILEMQIMRLQTVSRERSLTLEETKMLDLHIKNKRLLEDKSTINADYKTLPSDITEEELMRIAESVEESSEKKDN